MRRTAAQDSMLAPTGRLIPSMSAWLLHFAVVGGSPRGVSGLASGLALAVRPLTLEGPTRTMRGVPPRRCDLSPCDWRIRHMTTGPASSRSA
jgi:hypothetical protein